MNISEHTPGPWLVWSNIVCNPASSLAKNNFDHTGMQICKVEGFGNENSAEQSANARLIATSPEMLAVLKELVALDNCNYDRALQQKAYDKAKALIKKATGE